MSQDNWTPIYSICKETGLRVCEIYKNLLVREDGMINRLRFSVKKGWQQGDNTSFGYLITRIPCSKKTQVHRIVARAFIESFDDSLFVDHIDGNKQNNNFKNLRMVTTRQNGQNRKEHRNGSLVGARFHMKVKKWESRILINKKSLHIGYFNTKEEAHLAYLEIANSI